MGGLKKKDDDWVNGTPANFDPFSDQFDMSAPVNQMMGGMGMGGIDEEELKEYIDPKLKDLKEKIEKSCSQLQAQLDSLMYKHEDRDEYHTQAT